MIEEAVGLAFDSVLEKIMYYIGKSLFVFFNLFRRNKADLSKISKRKFSTIGYLFSVLIFLVTGFLIYKF